MMGLPDGPKSFKIGCRFDTVPAVKDSHPASHPATLPQQVPRLRAGKNSRFVDQKKTILES